MGQIKYIHSLSLLVRIRFCSRLKSAVQSVKKKKERERERKKERERERDRKRE